MLGRTTDAAADAEGGSRMPVFDGAPCGAAPPAELPALPVADCPLVACSCEPPSGTLSLPSALACLGSMAAANAVPAGPDSEWGPEPALCRSCFAIVARPLVRPWLPADPVGLAGRTSTSLPPLPLSAATCKTGPVPGSKAAAGGGGARVPARRLTAGATAASARPGAVRRTAWVLPSGLVPACRYTPVGSLHSVP